MKPYLLIAALFTVSCAGGNPMMEPTALSIAAPGVSHAQTFEEACGGPCAPTVGLPAPSAPQPGTTEPAPVVETPIEGPCGFVACPPPALNVPVASPIPPLPSPVQGAIQTPQACPVFAFDDPTCPHYGPCGNVPCAAPVR